MKKFVIMMTVLQFTACAQNNTKEIRKMYDIDKFIPQESKNITSKNYVGNIFRNIKRYDKEPLYYLRINKQNCLIEVYVNGMLRLKDYELSNYVTPFGINRNILRSGEQTVTIRMYPVDNLINESLGREGDPITELLDNSSVSIKVLQIENKSEKRLADEHEILTHISPNKNGTFIGAGKSYYEYSFTFNAQVPYEFEGWTNGQDLRKFDEQALTKQVLRFYRMMQDVFVNKDLEAYLKLKYLFNLRTKSASYATKKRLATLFEEHQQELNRNYTKLPIKEYKLEYRGGGKLVVLKHTNPDPFYRGALAAELEYIDEDGDLAALLPGITLYLPKGRRLEDGLMMWK